MLLFESRVGKSAVSLRFSYFSGCRLCPANQLPKSSSGYNTVNSQCAYRRLLTYQSAYNSGHQSRWDQVDPVPAETASLGMPTVICTQVIFWNHQIPSTIRTGDPKGDPSPNPLWRNWLARQTVNQPGCAVVHQLRLFIRQIWRLEVRAFPGEISFLRTFGLALL